MSIPLTVNNVVFDYPETDDTDWGAEATDWASAVTSGMLQKAGGLFQLLAEADFGSGFGVKSLYYKSRTANVADAGQLRLARADVINWRNQANDGNLSLGVSASNVLQFNGSDIQGAISVSDTATIDLDLTANVLSADIKALSIDNALISASAAIAFSKLESLSSANILVGSAGNVATSVAVTGDVTISNAGVTAIGANKVTNAQLAQMATMTIKGNNTGGASDPLDLTATQATGILNNFVGDSGSGGTKGLVLAPASGDTVAGKFLFADGTWKTPPGSGDVVGPASSTDSGFARFDGLTGKLLKNSPATITNADVIAAAGIALNKLAATTVSRALVSDASGFVTAATTTATEIGYVNGVTSSIQTQLGTKLPITITTTGDMIYSSSGTTASPLAIGSAGQFLGITSGIPAWKFPVYRSVTTTDAPSNADQTLVCSGASFTMTLPTAASVAGKMFVIMHNGTSLSQVYTLNTTSSQTIGGIASGSYALYTNGEVLTIVSDGSNWIILDHRTATATTSWTPTGSWSTNTTYSGQWWRSGQFFNGEVQLALAGAPTSANLTVNLLSNITIDTAQINGTTVGDGCFGNGSIHDNGTGNYIPICAYNSTTTLFIAFGGTTNNGAVNQASPMTFASGDKIQLSFKVPVVGWRP